MRRRRSLLCVLGVALLAFVVLPWAIAHDVSRTLTAQDRRVIEYVLRDTGVRAGAARGATFDQQITIIRKVQDAVFRIAPKDIGIPLGHTREPADLEKAGGGLCYDRSRSIEKFLEYAGFETRHASLYSTAETDSALKSLLSPGISSHAVSEVRTAKGWLLVGSLSEWLALDEAGRPVTATAMARALARGRPIRFQQPPSIPLLNAPFVTVYGLYSRHGRFYPPFDDVPDVNYAALLANL